MKIAKVDVGTPTPKHDNRKPMWTWQSKLLNVWMETTRQEWKPTAASFWNRMFPLDRGMDVKNTMVEHVSRSIFYNSYVDTNSSALL